eukprot:scaffold13499_cov207-Alexandrium_tamarense.AAC.11
MLDRFVQEETQAKLPLTSARQFLMLYTTTTYCRRRNSASSLAIGAAVHWKGEPLRYRGNTVLPK